MTMKTLYDESDVVDIVYIIGLLNGIHTEYSSVKIIGDTSHTELYRLTMSVNVIGGRGGNIYVRIQKEVPMFQLGEPEVIGFALEVKDLLNLKEIICSLSNSSADVPELIAIVAKYLIRNKGASNVGVIKECTSSHPPIATSIFKAEEI